MLYVATERAGWLIVGAGALPRRRAARPTAVRRHVQVRVDIWLHPFDFYDDADGAKSYQIVESMFGMGWGGLLGRGFGHGMPAADPPYAESDFIIGALGEELGLTGVIAVIVLYGLIVERALRASLICRDGFGKLMAVGLGSVRRAAGLRGHRRRHPADPAHRTHHAVPVVRRLVAGRQLGPDRVAAAHLRPRAAARSRCSPPTTTPTRRPPRW